jgi:hypothetical protein
VMSSYLARRAVDDRHGRGTAVPRVAKVAFSSPVGQVDTIGLLNRSTSANGETIITHLSDASFPPGGYAFASKGKVHDGKGTGSRTLHQGKEPRPYTKHILPSPHSPWTNKIVVRLVKRSAIEE